MDDHTVVVIPEQRFTTLFSYSDRASSCLGVNPEGKMQLSGYSRSFLPAPGMSSALIVAPEISQTVVPLGSNRNLPRGNSSFDMHNFSEYFGVEEI